jgi:undecaprenyl-diphosphatase
VRALEILSDPVEAGLDAAASTIGDAIRGWATGFFRLLDRKEGPLVERCMANARSWRLMRAARITTRAGNGWLYPAASLVLLLASFQYAARCIVEAAISLAIAFTIYPSLKRLLARQRPCHDNSLRSDAPPPLDRYSFPSGHAMTAAAFGVPIMIAAPWCAPLVIGGWAVMSWSRIALGHHYLSDIVAGTLIGGGIAGLATLVI